MAKLLLATGNQAKLKELRNLLCDLPYKLVTLPEVGISVKVDEIGNSLEENAHLKATVLASRSQLLTLADDSGLEVDALGGQPGVLSARYAGENASNGERMDYLLSRLKDVPWEKRRARFKCVIVICAPNGQVELCSGTCRGIITLKPRGQYGFGYDPIFYLPRLGKTMAELPQDIKNQVSHRGKAARKVFRILGRLKAGKTFKDF
jgi:XTP/dITP diphosphohydrolase